MPPRQKGGNLRRDMNGFNYFVFSGRVVGLTDVSYGDSKRIMFATIKHQERYKDHEGNWKNKDSFMDCKLFGFCRMNALATSISVGNTVVLSGKISSVATGNSDGGPLSKISLDVSNIEYIGDYDAHRYSKSAIEAHDAQGTAVRQSKRTTTRRGRQ